MFFDIGCHLDLCRCAYVLRATCASYTCLRAAMIKLSKYDGNEQTFLILNLNSTLLIQHSGSLSTHIMFTPIPVPMNLVRAIPNY